MKDTNHAESSPVIVIGLGNVFLGDDGFGPLAVETFRCQYACGPEVEVLDLGTPGLDLAPYLYDRKLVVIVDAVHSNHPLRTVSIFSEVDFLSSRACLRITGHDPGLWDTLTHLRLAARGPCELIVIGAPPESSIFGDGPSTAMLDLAAETAAAIAQVLAHRGILCDRRDVVPQPNLWWLPLNSKESCSAREVKVNA
ncbi:MAG: hydrogenase maturation protease [Terracidiphilus sp.]|jgi:hydrogenase maturation protease